MTGASTCRLRWIIRTRIQTDPLPIDVEGLDSGQCLADDGSQVLIGKDEFVPQRLAVEALTPAEVGGEIFGGDHRRVGQGDSAAHLLVFARAQDGVAVGNPSEVAAASSRSS